MDINCDLGEGEPPSRTRALLRAVTSANIACGGHAGDAESMTTCLRLCRELSVRAGAHPGFFDRPGFGRVARPITTGEFELLILRQTGSLRILAEREGIPLTHVKLHGALYHMVENNARLASAYVALAGSLSLEIYALAGSRVARRARSTGVPCRGEVFADRAYRADGSLVPRSEKGAILDDPAAVEARLASLLADGSLRSIEGGLVRREFGTICVHSDSPNALQIARLARAALDQ